jgi:uncharacterized protein Usg
MWIRKSIVTVDILYYMPDHSSILQEFIWQTEDIVPEIPRVHMFLNYWKNNIEATINRVFIMDKFNPNWRAIHEIVEN